jgi:hypothetical protein
LRPGRLKEIQYFYMKIFAQKNRQAALADHGWEEIIIFA